MFKLSERFGWGVKNVAFIKKVGAGNWTTSKRLTQFLLLRSVGRFAQKQY